VTLTPLRPSGAIQLAGQRVDVVTEGEFVAAGQTVVVIRVEGNKIIVAKESVIC
jgi:membrane-bound serine protease (ClpP class)